MENVFSSLALKSLEMVIRSQRRFKKEDSVTADSRYNEFYFLWHVFEPFLMPRSIYLGEKRVVKRACSTIDVATTKCLKDRHHGGNLLHCYCKGDWCNFENFEALKDMESKVYILDM
ncbi:hypothetical protein HELRODRAFT_183414 [Helobdella robusta]|uniref:Uncharacterized protein n=1 Tax=Helobdella robusta TaxID=6412 RepID=T1FJL6_HELRO|nr:hypothetical protein HELRODRAFT_183414 [Helobdella robusta]ESO11174.1 hypothetical protein HELRODRAFT_183414 [Helobdella robusta]